MHKILHNKCGGTAFYFREKLNPGDILKASNVVWINGEPAKSGEPIVCGSCGEQLSLRGGELSQLHWTDWFIQNF